MNQSETTMKQIFFILFKVEQKQQETKSKLELTYNNNCLNYLFCQLLFKWLNIPSSTFMFVITRTHIWVVSAQPEKITKPNQISWKGNELVTPLNFLDLKTSQLTFNFFLSLVILDHCQESPIGFTGSSGLNPLCWFRIQLVEVVTVALGNVTGRRSAV